MEIAYPFHINGRGRTAAADRERHIRHLIEQVLFTAPGERVNRPEFGTGLQALLFAPNSGELATATQFLVQGALQQWLGELIQVDSVLVEREGSSLIVTIQYQDRYSRQRHTAELSREV